MEKMTFWAAVHKETGFIQDVTRANGEEMATALIFASYKPEYRKEFNIKPVVVTVEGDAYDTKS